GLGGACALQQFALPLQAGLFAGGLLLARLATLRLLARQLGAASLLGASGGLTPALFLGLARQLRLAGDLHLQAGDQLAQSSVVLLQARSFPALAIQLGADVGQHLGALVLLFFQGHLLLLGL